MDKKWTVILCVIILAIVGLIAFYSLTNHENEVKIDNTTFQIPTGYEISNQTKDGSINLTNGTNNIYINKYDDKNVKKHVNEYIDKAEKYNHTTKISNFTVGKTLVYKSNINKSSSVHYWFVKNNKTYTIYSLDKNPEIDSITIKLIESIK